MSEDRSLRIRADKPSAGSHINVAASAVARPRCTAGQLTRSRIAATGRLGFLMTAIASGACPAIALACARA